MRDPPTQGATAIIKFSIVSELKGVAEDMVGCIFLFHFAFFLKIYKNKSNKTEFQNLYDYIFNQIELSIREIGYGDSTVNKKMKEYINLFYKIIDNVELWEKLNFNEKINFFSEFIDTTLENTFYIDYFNKYSIYLTKMSFNYFTKDVISHKF